MDKKGISDLFAEIAKDHPEKYDKVVSGLARLGFEVSTRDGSSVRLKDLHSPIDKDKIFNEAEEKMVELRKKNLPRNKYLEEAGNIWQKVTKDSQKALIDEGVKQNNTLCKITKAGARGSAQQLSQTIFAPIMFADAHGQAMVDTPIKKSYAEGLSLPEYLMSAYGARAGSVSTKLAVADSGYFAKNLARAAMTTKVEEADCGSNLGVEAPVSDRDSVGAFLAKPVGGYNRNNEVTQKMLHDLHNKEIKHIIIRSPITCESSKHFHHNAVCQMCAGKRERGLTSIGDRIGITSASGMGEATSQGTLCLSEYTEVLMADYSKKKIKDIQIGDLIFGADKTGTAFITKVVNKFDQGLQECYSYIFKDINIVCTPNHKILVKVNYDAFDVIPIGVQYDFKAVVGNEAIELTEIKYKGKLQCYDIEVGHPDHLFVLGNGMIVSNSMKHSSGSAAGPSVSTGFPLIKSLLNVPSNFPNKAAIAEHAGIVKEIKKAPQGGSNVQIGDHTYYAPEGYNILVNVGDHVEPGTVLSQGIVNPVDIVRLLGIGEGRTHLTHTLKKAFDEAGMGGINRRNFELLSKILIDNVRITDNEGLLGHLPGEVTSYQNLAKDYVPRSDSQTTRPDHALGKYLETPILHYTIGSLVTKKMVDELNRNKVESIVVHDKTPGFEAEMHPLADASSFEPDVFHQLYSTHLSGKLSKAVNTGGYSDLRGPSPVPGLAMGVGFNG